MRQSLSDLLPSKLSLPHVVFGIFGLLLLYLLINHFWHGGDNADSSAYQVLVTTTKVAAQEINDNIEALGTTTANEAVQLSATVTAKVQTVYFNDGQQVRKGDILVELDAGQQKANVAEQRVNLAEEQRQLDHLLKLITRKAISQTDLDKQQSIVNAARAKLESAQAELQDYIIRAPFSGILGVRKVSVGTLVSPGTVITTLDDLSSIKVDFSVPEIFLPYLNEGTAIEATSQTYPGKVFAGKINFVDNRIDPATRAINLRASLPNTKKNDGVTLRPGMLINVRVAQPGRQAIMIPERSIAPLRNEQFAFVVDEQNIAHKRSVQLGQRSHGHVEILSGIKVDETIVIDGAMNLQDGMAVNIQNSTVPAP